jgi:hypothetical protein
MLRQIRK